MATGCAFGKQLLACGCAGRHQPLKTYSAVATQLSECALRHGQHDCFTQNPNRGGSGCVVGRGAHQQHLLVNGAKANILLESEGCRLVRNLRVTSLFYTSHVCKMEAERLRLRAAHRRASWSIVRFFERGLKQSIASLRRLGLTSDGCCCCLIQNDITLLGACE